MSHIIKQNHIVIFVSNCFNLKNNILKNLWKQKKKKNEIQRSNLLIEANYNIPTVGSY